MASCTDGFSIYLVANEPLREGSYDVELTMDGGPVTCRIVLPGDPSAPEPACSNSARLRAFASIYNNGAPPDRTVPNAIIADVSIAPEVAVLKVRRDDAPLFEQHTAPSTRPSPRTVLNAAPSATRRPTNKSP